jgi:hypothetical protein
LKLPLIKISILEIPSNEFPSLEVWHFATGRVPFTFSLNSSPVYGKMILKVLSLLMRKCVDEGEMTFITIDFSTKNIFLD